MIIYVNNLRFWVSVVVALGLFWAVVIVWILNL
jgi:hypothetical protein